VCHTDHVAAVTAPLRRILRVFRTFPPVLRAAIVVIGASLWALGSVGPAPSAAAAMINPGPPPPPPTTTTSPPSTPSPLRAPKTTTAQDTKFFSEVAVADAALASYEQKKGNVALRALLTDGSAFCALLTRSGGLDTALVQEASGVRGTEAQTHLPLSVTTFNTIESVALLTLCPSEQKLVPGAVRSKIRNLGKHLSTLPTTHTG
jgi:hypothetical protein